MENKVQPVERAHESPGPQHAKLRNEMGWMKGCEPQREAKENKHAPRHCGQSTLGEHDSNSMALSVSAP